MDNRYKKIITWLLALVMIVTNVQTVFATEINEPDESHIQPMNITESSVYSIESRADLSEFESETIGRYKDWDYVNIILKLKDLNLETGDGGMMMRSSISIPYRRDHSDLTTDEGIKQRIENTTQSQDAFLAKMNTGGMRPFSIGESPLTVNERFNVLLNGFAMRTTYAKARELSHDPDVDWVHIETKFNHPQDMLMKNSSEIVNAGAAWDLEYKGRGKVVAVIDSGTDPEHEAMQTVPEGARYPDEASIQAKINASGGKLKGKFFSPKIPYGYNYADRMANPYVIKEKGTRSHGMHVAGTILGSKAGTFNGGIAPEAQLLAMRVFKDESGTDESVYMKALEDAVILGADGVNMSLGAALGYEGAIGQGVTEALQNLEGLGTVVSMAAGNDGAFGNTVSTPNANQPDYGLVGMPSVAPEALSVASFNNTIITTHSMLVEDSNGTRRIPFKESMTSINALDLKLELVDVNKGTEEDFNSKDVKDKAVLIEMDAQDMSELLNRAYVKGAKLAIIYSNKGADDELIDVPVFATVIATVSINKVDAKALKDGTNVFVTVQGGGTETEWDKRGEMSEFSSWGASIDLKFKPEITAPGGNIFSTLNSNQYGMMSGTSMASPHVAGGTLLVKERIEKDFPGVIRNEKKTLTKNLLMSTAMPTIDKVTKLPVSPRNQGAGVMNIYGAVNSNAVAINPNHGESKILLGDNIGTGTVSFPVRVKNYGEEALNYSVKTLVITDQTENGKMTLRPEKILEQDEAPITVPANGEVDVNINFTIPNMEELKAKMPNGFFVEGFVYFTHGEDSVHNISIPFIGFSDSWKDIPVIEKSIYDMDIASGERPFYFGDGGLNATYLATEVEGISTRFVLGLEKDGNEENLKTNRDKIAISPNGDRVYDKAIFSAVFYRNAKNTSFSLLNEEGTVLESKDLIKNISKNYFSGNYRNRKSEILGSYTPESNIEDGKYTLRLKYTPFGYDNEQHTDYPIIIDREAPKVVQTIPNPNEKDYQIIFNDGTQETHEKVSGIYSVETEYKGEKTDVEFSELGYGYAQAAFTVPENVDKNEYKVIITDWARNKTTATLAELLNQDEKGSIKIESKLEDGTKILDVDYDIKNTEDGSYISNPESTAFGKYLVSPKNLSDVYTLKKVTLNGEEVENIGNVEVNVNQENKDNTLVFFYEKEELRDVTVIVDRGESYEGEYKFIAADTDNNVYEFKQDTSFDHWFVARVPLGAKITVVPMGLVDKWKTDPVSYQDILVGDEPIMLKFKFYKEVDSTELGREDLLRRRDNIIAMYDNLDSKVYTTDSWNEYEIAINKLKAFEFKTEEITNDERLDFNSLVNEVSGRRNDLMPLATGSVEKVVYATDSNGHPTFKLVGAANIPGDYYSLNIVKKDGTTYESAARYKLNEIGRLEVVKIEDIDKVNVVVYRSNVEENEVFPGIHYGMKKVEVIEDVAYDITGVEAPSDKEELGKLIKKAEATIESPEDQNYAKDSVDSLKSVIETAKEAYNNPKATEQEIKAAIENLNKAIDDLVDLRAFKALIKLAEEKLPDKDLYTNDSWVEFEAALDMAKQLIDLPQLTKEHVQAGMKALEDKMNALVKAKVYEISFGSFSNGKLEGNTGPFRVKEGTKWSVIEAQMPKPVPNDGYEFRDWFPELPKSDDVIVESIQYNARFKVKGGGGSVPSICKNVQAVPGDGTIAVTWEAPDNDGGSPITKYQILIDDYWNDGELTTIDVGTNTDYRITGLDNGTNYRIRIVAHNANGKGPVTKAVFATPFKSVKIKFEAGENGTLEGKTLFEVPQGTKYIKIRSEVPTPKANPGYKFKEWAPLLPESGLYEFDKDHNYVAQFEKIPPRDLVITFEAENGGTFEGNPQLSFNVKEHTPWGQAEITVPTPKSDEGYTFLKWSPVLPIAEDTIDESQRYSAIFTKDGEEFGVPTKPLDAKTAGGNQKITITWNPPAYDGGKPITGYIINLNYTDSDGVEQKETQEVAPDTLSHTFEGLVNGRPYKITVQAVNEIGPGAKSEELTERPKETLKLKVEFVAEEGGYLIGDRAFYIPANTYFSESGIEMPRAVAKQGYKFVEWTPYNPEEEDKSIGADALFTAKFEKLPVEKVKITFKAGENGALAANAITELEIDKGTAWRDANITLPGTVPSEGYEFDKWTPEIPSDNSLINQDMEFTANFKVKPVEKVKITFKAGENGSFTEGVQTEFEIDKGTAWRDANITIPTAVPAENYVFDKWTPVIPDEDTVIDENMEFTAIFKEKDTPIDKVKISFVAGEHGKLKDGDAAEYEVEKGKLWGELGIQIPRTVADSGYVFDKWSPAIPSGQTKVDEEMKFTAVFKVKSVTPDPTPTPNPTPTPTPNPTPKPPVNGIKVESVAGSNRYETAIELSKKMFENADNLVIACGENYPDALAASVLASELNGPLLLNPTNSLQDAVKAEVERLGAKNVTLVGGENSLVEAVALALNEMGVTVNRIAGENRYETAAKITAEIKKRTGNTSHVILASGLNYADALAIAPYAGIERAGILLVANEFEESTLKELEGVKEVTLIGGLNSISREVENELTEKGINVTRIAGEDRYKTAMEIGKRFFPNATKALVVSGETYPDALSGSVFAIKEKAPTFLVQKNSILPELLDYLKNHETINELMILGGENTISSIVREQLKTIER